MADARSSLIKNVFAIFDKLPRGRDTKKFPNLQCHLAMFRFGRCYATFCCSANLAALRLHEAGLVLGECGSLVKCPERLQKSFQLFGEGSLYSDIQRANFLCVNPDQRAGCSTMIMQTAFAGDLGERDAADMGTGEAESSGVASSWPRRL